jgi:hypothetical protein
MVEVNPTTVEVEKIDDIRYQIDSNGGRFSGRRV